MEVDDTLFTEEPMSITRSRAALAAVGLLVVATLANAHGNVSPQPVNTDALPEVGEEWLTENPYRGADKEVWEKAVEIGSSGFNENCARCHGLQAISGGAAPDLRFLSADEEGDSWFVERFLNGYTQDGVTKMPAWEDVLDQKAAWAIRTYIETRPGDGEIDPYTARLTEIKDILEAGTDVDNDALKAELTDIAAKIPTGSGAPVADSIAFRAAKLLDGTPEGFKQAGDTLITGLSIAQ
jgi:cytochrome c-550 PedF